MRKIDCICGNRVIVPPWSNRVWCRYCHLEITITKEGDKDDND